MGGREWPSPWPETGRADTASAPLLGEPGDGRVGGLTGLAPPLGDEDEGGEEEEEDTRARTASRPRRSAPGDTAADKVEVM